MNYYDYRGYFQELNKNTEQIIENQEKINTNLNQIILTTSVIAFVVILNMTIGIVKKVFAVR